MRRKTKAKYAEQVARKKAARKEAGVCIRCGEVPPAAGIILCAKCRERDRANRRSLKDKRRSAGTCTTCGVGPAVAGFDACQRCSDYAIKRDALRHRKNRSLGACSSCAGPSRPGRSLCAECAQRVIEAQRKRRLERVANGLCIYCGVRSPEEDTTRCAKCASSQRWTKIKGTYGLTRDEYEGRLARQGGVCGCCGATSFGRKGSGWFAVDHDHATGQVRGLLCNACNLMAGHVGDDVRRLRRLIQYIEGEATWQKKRLSPLSRVLPLFPGKEGTG